MCDKTVVVQNEKGICARPATRFVAKAVEFKSSVWVEMDNQRRVNAKSLLGVLSLGISQGDTINIIASGADEEEAVDQIVKLVEAGCPGN